MGARANEAKRRAAPRRAQRPVLRATDGEVALPRRASGGDKLPFAAAFDAVGRAMLVVDARAPDCPIVYANTAFLALTGYRAKDVIGRNCRFLQGQGTDAATVARIDGALHEGRAVEVEILNYRKDGAPFWNRLRIDPVADERGDITHFVSTQADVSAEVEAREGLAQALERKAGLLKDVNHRVKNNLQIIASILLLKSRRLQDEAGRRALADMADRISALSAVHGQMQLAEEARRVEVGAFVGEIVTLAVDAAHPRVALDFSIAPVFVSAEKASPLALLVNELTSETVRRAFPGTTTGKLSVSLAVADTHFSITIADEGGMREPSANSGDTGFEATLIEMLVRQLGATLVYTSTREGARAVLTVPREG